MAFFPYYQSEKDGMTQKTDNWVLRKPSSTGKKKHANNLSIQAHQCQCTFNQNKCNQSQMLHVPAHDPEVKIYHSGAFHKEFITQPQNLIFLHI